MATKRYFSNQVLFLICIISSFITGSYAKDADKELTEKIAICARCHKIDNTTEDPIIPRLNGQVKEYLIKQTRLYVSGKRFDTVMSKVIKKTPLSDEDIIQISDFYSRLPVMYGDTLPNDLSVKGQTVFIDLHCEFCHKGNDPDRPLYIKSTAIIAGQNNEYLYKSMKDIQSGIRQADEFNLMFRVLSHMTDEEVEAVAEYLSTLK